MNVAAHAVTIDSCSALTSQPDLLGESPFWHPSEQALYWVDIAGKCIKRLLPDGQIESWQVHCDPGCIAPRAGRGLVVALRDGIYLAQDWGQRLSRVARLPYDPSVMRANDGKAGPDGRFWVGTIYEPRDRPAAGLYSVDFERDDDPRVWLQAGEATVGNGLAWSPDARTLYWSDTKEHVIYAWDWDCESNSMDNPRVFHRFGTRQHLPAAGQTAYGGRPDGAAVDAEGNYWCAMFEGGRLAKISPAGAVVDEIELPVLCPTMLCFGGQDLKTVFVTSCRLNRSAQELAQFPLAGHVLSFRVEVPGLPANRVAV